METTRIYWISGFNGGGCFIQKHCELIFLQSSNLKVQLVQLKIQWCRYLSIYITNKKENQESLKNFKIILLHNFVSI